METEKNLKQMIQSIDKRWFVVFLFLAILFSILIAGFFWIKKNPKQLANYNVPFLIGEGFPVYTISLQPETGNFKAGEQIPVEVYLSGDNIENITVIEFGVKHDPGITLISAKPGGFFKDPIKVKWDEENGLYALSLNPLKKEVDSKLPVLNLLFKVGKESQVANILFAEVNKIYLRDKGSFNLTTKGGEYSLNAASEPRE